MKSTTALCSLLALTGAAALFANENSHAEQKTGFIEKKMVVTGNMRCTDSNTGSGFIMYTERFVNDRWNEDKVENDFRKHNAKNFVCVKYADDRWQYDTNWADEEQRASSVSWHPFLPDPSDVLVAIIDYSDDKVFLLNGTDKYKTFQGMTIGYALGDIGIYPNEDIDGKPDQGEVRLNGTYFVPWPHKVGKTTGTTTPPPPKIVNGSIYIPVQAGNLRCTNSNTGPGFIMYSQQPVNSRWTLDRTEVDFRSHTAQNFVCVRYKDSNWWYDNNWEDEKERASLVSWHVFMPTSTDILMASVDYTADKVMDLKATNVKYMGIQMGFKDSDLVFHPNQAADGSADTGSFRISGGYLSPWFPVKPGTTTTTTTTTTGTTTTPIYLHPPPSGKDLLKLQPVVRRVGAGTIRCSSSNIAPGFIMYSEENVITRFNSKVYHGQLGIDPRRHSSVHLLCVRFWQDKWQYDSDGYNAKRWNDFTPVPTDVGIAAVDFLMNQITSTRGTRARSYGLQIGYVTGNLGLFKKNRFGDYAVRGGKFQSWGTVN